AATADRAIGRPPPIRSSRREPAQTSSAAREETTVGRNPAPAGCCRRIWDLEEPPPPTAPSVALLRSIAADVSRRRLHSRPAKKRPFEAIRLTPDATRRIWDLDEPPPPTVPSVAPLRSVAADVSRLKLHSRPAKKRPFEAIRLTPDATRRIWDLDEPPPSTVPSVAPLRSVAADVSRLKLHSRPAKKRPFEAIRLTPDAARREGNPRSRHRRPVHPSHTFHPQPPSADRPT